VVIHQLTPRAGQHPGRADRRQHRPQSIPPLALHVRPFGGACGTICKRTYAGISRFCGKRCGKGWRWIAEGASIVEQGGGRPAVLPASGTGLPATSVFSVR